MEFTYWYTQCHRVDWQPKQYAFWLLEIYLLPYWHESFNQFVTSPHCNSSQYCYNNLCFQGLQTSFSNNFAMYN